MKCTHCNKDLNDDLKFCPYCGHIKETIVKVCIKCGNILDPDHQFCGKCGSEAIRTEIKNAVADIEGNVYNAVQIGEQVWMSQNMKVTVDRDGNKLVLGKDYWYPNGDESLMEECGLLYTWDAAMRITPQGWHLPSDAEWDENNATVFSAVSAGNHSIFGYNDFGIAMYLWSATQCNSSCAYGWNSVKLRYGTLLSEGMLSDAERSEYRTLVPTTTISTKGRMSAFLLIEGKKYIVPIQGIDWDVAVGFTIFGNHKGELIYFLNLGNYPCDVYTKTNGHSVRCLRD